MIEVESVTFRNFMSYGSYETTIPIGKLGPCLITGEVVNDGDIEGESSDRSNGAGKSTTYNSLLWCLFGRTMHADRPGDNIVNDIIGKDCLVRTDLKNGDSITRTRKTVGHDELMVQRGGDTLLSTLSVMPNQQKQLNNLYGLDWHMFCQSSFCTQYSRPWFELPDGQRKKELERALRLDRFSYYAASAKEKFDAAQNEQTAILAKREKLATEIAELQEELDSTIEAQVNFEAAQTKRLEQFEADRATRKAQAIEQAKNYLEKAREIEEHDLDDLKERWTNAKKAQEAVQTMATKVSQLLQESRDFKRQAASAQATVDRWVESAGTVCTECEQEIPHTHSEEKIAPFLSEVEEAVATAQALEEKARSLEKKKELFQKQINESLPPMTVETARAINDKRANLADSAKRWSDNAKKIDAEKPPAPQTFPSAGSIERYRQKIAAKQKEHDAIAGDLERTDLVIKHMGYIYKSYHDRKKIKSFSMAKHRPYLNSRFRYYLDKFRVKRKMELTDALTVDTDGRSYTYMSGGERARVNVAFMLARFDVHRSAFGRQSNVVVLDEVDGRLDAEGIEALVDVVMNEIAPRVDSVLVVSQRASMRDSFPHQLVVRKENEFSVISEIR